MLCCVLFFISGEAFWSCLCGAKLCDLLYLLLNCLTSTTSWYAVWSSPYHVVLHEIWSSWCYISWPYLLHATLLHPSHVMSSCLMSSESMYAVWSCRHDAKLMVFFLYLTLCCLTLPTSCQFASSFPYHASLPGLVFMMLRCLILSTSCYAASPSRCHTTLPGIFVWIFEFVFILLCCLTVFTSCRTAWPLIATSYYLLYLLQITVFQLDLVFVVPTLHGVICFMLPCVTLSTSCQTASCPLFWSCLYGATLLDLLYLVLPRLTLPTSSFAASS